MIKQRTLLYNHTTSFLSTTHSTFRFKLIIHHLKKSIINGQAMQRCQKMQENAKMHKLGILGYFRVVLGDLGHFWSFLVILGRFWANFGQF